MNDSLFSGEHLYLTAPDSERDAETISRWMHDTDFLRLVNSAAVRPLSPGRIKKDLEELAKRADKDEYQFVVRAQANNRLLGLVRLHHILWTSRSAMLQISIGDLNDRGKGYGQETLKLMTRYAFDELNLHRIGAITFKYNLAAIKMLESGNFVQETCLREALNRAGRRWDIQQWGLLCTDKKPNRYTRDTSPMFSSGIISESGITTIPKSSIKSLLLIGAESSMDYRIDYPLFLGRLVRLTAIDPAADSVHLARWSRDSEFHRLFDADPARPQSTGELVIKLEDNEKNKTGFYFLVRTIDDDQPIGVAELDGIEWSNGNCFLSLGLGDRNYWNRGYGSDAIRVLLQFAFTELNLHRVSLTVFANNQRAVHVYRKLGFVHEGCAREFLDRDGHRYDMLFMGILQSEWRPEK